MPEFSKKLIQFKDRVDKKHEKVKEEIEKIKLQVEELEAQKNDKSIQSITGDDHNIDDQIKRLQELLAIQRDHKRRLSAEVLRLANRNPGLIKPEFEEE